MTRILTLIIGFILGAVLTVFVGFKILPGMMMKEVESPLAFEETLETIEANAKELGWKVPNKWKVNFQNNFQKIVGVDIGPNKVLKMCEPQAAADILIHDDYKILSVMMPCTIAVYQKSDGKTYIGIMNMDFLGMMFGGPVTKALETVGPQMVEMIDLKAK